MGYQIRFYTTPRDSNDIGNLLKHRFDLKFLAAMDEDDSLSHCRYREVQTLCSERDNRLPYSVVNIFRPNDPDIHLFEGNIMKSVIPSEFLRLQFSPTDFSKRNHWVHGRLYASNFRDLDFQRERSKHDLPKLSTETKQKFERFRKSVYAFIRKSLIAREGLIFGSDCLDRYERRRHKPVLH